MTIEDRKRLYVIRQVIERKLKQKKAAEMLGVTKRQVIRLAKRVKAEGDKGDHSSQSV